MKAGSLLGVVIIIIAIAACVVVLNRDGGGPDEEPDDQGITFEEASSGGNFIQRAPADDTVPVAPQAAEHTEHEEDAVDASEPTVTPATAGETVTISMTDTGFEPAEVTITAGDTVTFINNAQAAKWPASDVHPSHEVLPAFDAKRGLATGEEYSFTFTEPGTWKYHDHLRASQGGSVTVTK